MCLKLKDSMNKRNAESLSHRENPTSAGLPWLRFSPLLIVLAAFAVYANTFAVPFAFDDDMYILENPAVKEFRYFFDPEFSESAISQGWLTQNFRTRKVVVFSFALNHWLHALWLPGYHLVNLLVHLLNGLLVYGLVRATLRTPLFNPGNKRTNGGAGNIPALAAALLFVVHPVQTEAVTYICQRFTSMATLFYLLSLVLYVHWRLTLVDGGPGVTAEHDLAARSAWYRRALYWLALAAALLAMFSKEIAFTLPVLLILYEGMFFGRPRPEQVWALLPFVATMLIIPLIILGQGASYSDMQRLTASLTGPVAENSMLPYLFTQFRVIITYLRLFFFPVSQNLDYDYPRYTEFFQLPVAGSFVFLCLLAAGSVYLFCLSARHPIDRNRWLRLISFGILWFFVTLAVESSFMPLLDVLFEHRLYLPMTGLVLALVGLGELLQQRFFREHGRAAGLFPVIILLTVMAVAAHARNNLWRDPVALWEDAVAKSPEKARPHHNLASEYRLKNRFDDAIREYETAWRLSTTTSQTVLAHKGLEEIYQSRKNHEELRRIHSALLAVLEKDLRKNGNDPNLHNELGRVYMKMERHAEAEKSFRRAIELKGNYALFHQNLGKLYLSQNRLDEALMEMREAVRLYPDSGFCLENLGDVLEARGEEVQAMTVYLKARQGSPRSNDLYIKIAMLYSRMGQELQAERILRKEAERRGDEPTVRNELGLYYLSRNRFPEADRAFHEALLLDDTVAATHLNLGALFLQQGQVDQAMQFLRRAEELDPYLPDIYYNRGLVSLFRKKYTEAVFYFQKVLTLAPDDPEAREKFTLSIQLRDGNAQDNKF